MKILLFGGTFDPPHMGHVSLLRNAIAVAKPDKVVVMPAGIPPHKQASATPGKLRMEMCRCFLPCFPNLEISDIEIKRQGSSYTWDSLQQLKRQNPQGDFYLCIGSDMLLYFEKWHRYQEILQMVTIVAQDREETDIPLTRAAAKELHRQGGKVLFTGGKIEEISSTQLRKALAGHEDVSAFIPKETMQVIEENGLYQDKSNR